MSTFSFKKSAQESISLSRLHAGRTQLDTDDIIGQTLTIVEFDIANMVEKKTGEVKQFGVFVFEECPEKYYNGGYVLTKMAEVWAAAFNGDTEAASIALANEGGVPIRCTATKTKDGNNLTNIEIL